MRLHIEAMLNYSLFDAADIMLMVEVAPMPDQRLIRDHLIIDGVGPLSNVVGESDVGRRTWTHATRGLIATYHADVEVDRPASSLAKLEPTPLNELPASVIPYIWPSRYCESDRLEAFVARAFPGPANGAKIIEMAEWLRANMDYVIGASDGNTTAVDAFVSRRGVCRDFAHVLISFARASGIPARMVSAYAAELEFQDFHAVVEVWLGDGWHLVDASGMAKIDGIARIGVGRDATDIAFMTVFGSAMLIEQSVMVEVVG